MAPDFHWHGPRGVLRVAAPLLVVILAAAIVIGPFNGSGLGTNRGPRKDGPPQRSFRTPRRLRVFSWVDRINSAADPSADICSVLKGWVANNVHGTLIWGSLPHVPPPVPMPDDALIHQGDGKPPKHGAIFQTTMGKWVHTLPWVARQSRRDLLMFVDAFDAYFQLGPDEILRRYAVAAREERRKDVLIMSAEAWCSPWFSWGPWAAQKSKLGKAHELCQGYKPAMFPYDVQAEVEDARRVGAGPEYPSLPPPAPATPQPLLARFLNTGALAGPASALLRFYAMMIYLVPYRDYVGTAFGDYLDDQALASWLVLNSTVYNLGARLDRASRLAYSAHDVWDKEMESVPAGDPDPVEPRRFWRHKATGSVPALVHFNGDGKHADRLFRAASGFWWFNATPDDVAEARERGTRWWKGSVRVEGHGKKRLADICPDVWDLADANLRGRLDEEGQGDGWFGELEDLEGPKEFDVEAVVKIEEG
ncbi:hypothetical protein DFJ74DRAFT_705207 [Hyaloraphidium curvatum]|nr:hypothetical protein DFJ74DRAFT_705207 [Hyaloraphidium curvatum]